ncbi:glutathione S-transferase family protein [Pantoea sp. 1.19]|uniref:glutathione S-transferase family protein n=1 Tax=Pantoea sp. 1.19 TaxID=1925589 RepID=UPI000948DC25|nr:glutathione S-transferase family protein [Pantoea sp. 1.19]
MMEVWGRRTSSNVQAVMWCLAELNLPVTRYDVGHRFGGNDTPAFLAMNPNGLVPVLKDGEAPPLFESAAINRYLANRYGQAPFWPADLATRTRIDMWAEWAKVSVSLRFTAPIFWQLVRVPAADRNLTALNQAIDQLSRLLAIADAQLQQHDYLAGDALTLADIPFGSLLYRYYDLDMPRAPLPALAEYYARLCERPAYQQHVIVSYDELRLSPP